LAVFLIIERKVVLLELKEALEILRQYHETIVYLIASNLTIGDSLDLDKAIGEIVSYLDEGGEDVGQV